MPVVPLLLDVYVVGVVGSCQLVLLESVAVRARARS